MIINEVKAKRAFYMFLKYIVLVKSFLKIN